MIEIRVTGLENLQDAEGELREWGERPFDGGAALRIKKNWTERIDKAYTSKGKSVGMNWPPLSPAYAAWKRRHFPNRPLLVLRGHMRDSLTNESSRNMIFNRAGGRQLILGTRIKYAKFHQYGTKRMPARPFIKIDQGLVNDWAQEMRKDVEKAMKGSSRWRER
jgi:phage gpG-like protein